MHKYTGMNACALMHSHTPTHIIGFICMLQVQKALVDVENMFDLLATEPRVKDKPDAKPLSVVSGKH